MPSVLSPPQALNRSPHASAEGLQHRSAAADASSGWVIPLRFSACPPLFRCSARAREQERGSCPPLDLGGPGVTAEPETKGAMTEDIGMEAAAALDETMERHLVAQRAVADVVREW